MNDSENNALLELLSSTSTTQVELLPTLFNFFICIAMSFVLRSVYLRRSFSLTGKNHIGSIIPILSVTVFLVIVIVKSSLALSLGLVGALSIVRFRTPIKEPEELVYLFLAIAIGLGYAAGQVLITTVLMSIIIALIFIWLSNRKLSATNEFNLVLSWKDKKIDFQEMLSKLETMTSSVKIIRYDTSSSDSSAVLLVSPDRENFIDSVHAELESMDPDLRISFFESKTNW
ncbi:DUF4956 domain-containing protein [Gammaproteobacteria bacterium]|jgi:hypothetical protein|nr:DUF4956 domain-containing protein [Gammaproteobacteria bacterium]